MLSLITYYTEGEMTKKKSSQTNQNPKPTTNDEQRRENRRKNFKIMELFTSVDVISDIQYIYLKS